MANNRRTYDGVYNALKQISDEEGVDFGLDGMSQEDFKRKYFTGPGNIENLYNRLSEISDEEGIDFGQGSRDEWLSSFGYKRNTGNDQDKYKYLTLEGNRVGGKPAPSSQKVLNDAQQTLNENQRVINRMGNQEQRMGLDLPQEPIRLGQNRKITKGQRRYNIGTGQMEQTYITPSGNEYGSRELADLEQNAIDINERGKTLPGQLENANLERKRLQAMIDELEGKQSASMKENNGFVYHDKNIFSDEDWEQLQALKAAYRTNEERAVALEAERDDAGFWRGFVDAVMNPATVTLGLTDFATISSLYKIKDKIDNARAKGKEVQLTDAEQTLLENTVNNNYVQQQYGDNRGFLYRAGGISMQALPFVAEFYLTGGFSALTQAGAKYGTELAEKLALEGFKKALLRNTGILAGDIAAGWVMANTTGAMRTGADIMKRHMGEVTINPEGQYDFEGGKSLGRSIYEAEVANTLEYYTEKLGEHLQLGKWIAKGAEKMGLSKLSKAVNYLSNSEWLNRGGIQDYPSEVVEEQANLVLNALLVGDNNFGVDPNSKDWDKSVFNGKTQADIWGGMMFSLGLMQAPRLAYTGTQAAGYYAYKRNVDVANNSASIAFGEDNWQMIKEQIDNCDNEHMSELVNSIAQGDINPMQKQAAMNYAGNLLKMRGYNMGMMADAKDEGNDIPQNAVSRNIDQNFQEGYETQEPDLKKELIEEARAAEEILPQYGQEFAKMVSESESPVETMDYLMQNRDLYTN